MKIALKNIIFGLCFVPLLLKVPYLIRVWTNSPTEEHNYLIWLMLVVSIPLCEYFRRVLKIYYSKEPYSRWGYVGLGFLFLIWSFVAFKINAAGILLAILIIAVGTNLRFGRKVFMSQVPSYFIAILGCPSVSFWLDYYLQIGLGEEGRFLDKILLSSFFLFLWILTAAVKGRYPRIINMILYCVICTAFLFNRTQSQSQPTGDSLYIDESKLVDKSNKWLGTDIPIKTSEMRFLSGYKKVVKRVFYSDKNIVNMLTLKVKNVSAVHPIAICLTSGGIDVKLSRQIQINLGSKIIQVNELILDIDSREVVAYSWFSNDTITTGDFHKFRLSPLPKEGWIHYQLIIGNSNGTSLSVQESRKVLQDFLSSFNSFTCVDVE